MSRKSKYRNQPLTEAELESSFFRARKNIEVLVDSFLNGNAGAVEPMSGEIIKMFTEGNGARLRFQYRYIAPEIKFTKTSLSPQHPLTILQMKSEDGVSSSQFLPAYCDRELKPKGKFRDFKIWWEEDIFIAGCAQLGTRQDMIPIKKEEQVHFSKRVKLTRERIIRLYRNKVGSHTDKKIPENLKLLMDNGSWGAGMLTGDPRNPIEIVPNNNPIEATICQIGLEICYSVPLN
jgi:hypothetical protein